MTISNLDEIFRELSTQLEGELFTDAVHRLLYATDASIFREVPVAVSCPKTRDDLKTLIRFASENGLSLIPRAAGTSLAGQVVGSGIVVDISRHLNRILELNLEERWVEVEPGVVLDELNLFLKPHGLFFGPETSTSNRCMIGGMVANNACGAHSIIYGSTREHTLEVEVLLSDGSEARFKGLTADELIEKGKESSLEGTIYRHLNELLSDPGNQESIREGYPDPKVKRRNTGYALDLLLDTDPFDRNYKPFNLSTLIAGSEGTLAFITTVRLNLVPLPPPVQGLVCSHFASRQDAFHANLIALKYNPGAVEMMDHFILDCTLENLEQQRNRFFIQGDPAAVLIIEFAGHSKEELELQMGQMEEEMKAAGLGYHFPRVFGPDMKKVWDLRKAGLGVLSNLEGDARPVSLIEDTAVNPEFLPLYMKDFEEILGNYGKECVYHAHIGSGELHLRPVLNLRDPAEVEIAHQLGREVALLVKKYRGSLSGEHGDGRLRGEFIPLVLGERNYGLLRSVKQVFDPQNIFNPGKIVDAPSLKENLRVVPGTKHREIRTWFRFDKEGGILRAAEKCNGSGDCRKSELMGGTMCPSYMATRDENTTTRARANLLREVLSNSEKQNPFDHRELYDILDLCLSCKGCKSECPSNVDMAKQKSEFLQNWHEDHSIPLRSRLVAGIRRINQLASVFPEFYNRLMTWSLSSRVFKKLAGFAEKRSLPLLSRMTVRRWAKKHLLSHQQVRPIRKVWFFIDEFTNYQDAEIGIKAIKLLCRLGYEVAIPPVWDSGRAHLSKGFLKTARKIASGNLRLLKDKVSPASPLVGLEPSAILSFRDEYPDLVPAEFTGLANQIAQASFTIEEFLVQEVEKGILSSDAFTREPARILVHGHCQQKAIVSSAPMLSVLNLPENYSAEEIKSGCCGMAGSFGYEKEHYDLSMKIGELVLFPAVRAAGPETVISAPGTSCRHQILDGTGRKALHPVEILYEALKEK